MSIILHKPRVSIAVETIDFQDNTFGIALEEQITNIVNKIKSKEYSDDSKIKKSQEVSNLTKIIFDRLGIRVNFITNSMLAGVLPLYPTKYHIFVQDFLKGNFKINDQEKLLKDFNQKLGYVDTKKAKLGGVFSEYTNKLYMNFNHLVSQYSLNGVEITAIALHELGHIFHACEYSDRIDTNNQVLANLFRTVIAKSDKVDKEYVFREIKKINERVTAEEIELLLSDNKTVAGTKWMQTVLLANGVGNGSQMGSFKYAETSFEQLADSFASRFNYGKHLAFALEKTNGKRNPEKSKYISVYLSIIQIITMFLLCLIIAKAFALGYVVFSSIGALFIFSLLIISGERFKDYTYDELKLRYKRIRNEVIELLKTDDLTEEEAKQVIDNIHSLDDIINDTNIHKLPMDILSNLLIPVNYRANKAIKEEQLLEELAHNKLFIKAAELRY